MASLPQTQLQDGMPEVTSSRNHGARAPLTEVPAVDGDLRASLVRMRARMLSDRPYEAAVFIGGMEGVIDEFDALRESAPGVRLIPLPTPGGVSRELFERAENLPREMRTRTDFTYWLYRLLDIDPSEPRLLVDAGTGDDDSRSE